MGSIPGPEAVPHINIGVILVDGWPFLFGIGLVLLIFFRSSVWLLPLPLYTPPPSGELYALLCFLLHEFSRFFLPIFFSPDVVKNYSIPLVACGAGGFS